MANDITAESVRPQVRLGNRDNQADLRAAFSSGSIARVTRAVYLEVDRGEQSWQTASRQALAACVGLAQLQPWLVFSHTSAAIIHGFAPWRVPEQVHTTQANTASSTNRPGVFRHSRPLSPEEITVRYGLRVTSIDRTVIDCVMTLPAAEGLVIADAALRSLVQPRRDNRAQADDRAAEHRSRWIARLKPLAGHRGVRRARLVLPAASPWAESGAESLVRWICRESGLPDPTPQVRVQTRLGAFYPDLTWFDEAGHALLHLEFDGLAKYGNDIAALAAEKSREDAIRESSAPVIRVVMADLRRPEALVARIRKALAAVPSSRTRSSWTNS